MYGSGNWKDGGEANPADASLQCFWNLEVAYRGLTGGISGVTHVQRQQEPYFSERRITKYLFVRDGRPPEHNYSV